MVAALLAVGLQTITPSLLPRAEAGSNTLCVGFGGCASEGKHAHGYKKNWSNMYWLMFPYRNCVNYVAYRVIQDGGPTSRPWTGSGNATNWGRAMSHATDHRPTKGSVAWWKAYDGGSGRYGHVAYVERVISSNEILISESNWGSNFSWRRITKGGGDWPTGFIHFTDNKVMRNVVKPRVAGKAKVGSHVRVAGGKWKPLGKPSYAWFADGKRIPGADKRRIRLGPHQQGKRVSVRVTGSKPGYRSTSVRSAATKPVARGKMPIVNTKRPRLKGAPWVGDTVTVVGGKWRPYGQPSYAWYAGGDRIKGADGRSLKIPAGTAGKRIYAKVTGSKAGYRSTTANSHAVTARAKVMRNTKRPAITGTTKPGRTVAIKGGGWRPLGTPHYRWFLDGRRIAGADNRWLKIRSGWAGKKLVGQVTGSKPGFRSSTVKTRPQRITR